eukprot:6491955-Amphidinium_carterae.1
MGDLDLEDESRLTTVAADGLDDIDDDDGSGSDDDEESSCGAEPADKGVASTSKAAAPAHRGAAKKAAGKAHAKAKQAVGSLSCSGCFRQIAREDAYPSTNFCRPCKKAYDSLAKLSVRQQQQAWWETTRAAPKLLKKALQTFKKRCPDLNVGRGRKRSANFSIAKFEEEVSATKRVQDVNRAKWLTYDEFMGFAKAQPPLGWGLSDQQARVHWAEETDGKRSKFVRRGGQLVELFRVKACYEGKNR